MSGKSIQFIIILMITFISTVVIADELVYRYEGDVLPDDPAAGWEVFAACDGFCTPSSQDGHLVFTFSGGSSIVNYTFKITEHPDEPSLDSLWIEWNFRSDQELGPIFTGRDAKLKIQFAHILDLVVFYGDAVIPFSGSGGVRNLNINEFHTYRF